MEKGEPPDTDEEKINFISKNVSFENPKKHSLVNITRKFGFYKKKPGFPNFPDIPQEIEIF